MQYAVCQIGGRQYLVKPGQTLEVDKLKNERSLTVDKVLLIVDSGKVEMGRPYLKTVINFEVLGNVRKDKIRVATYKAKANFRRVKGQRSEMTKIKILEEKIQEVKTKAKKSEA